MSSRCFCLTERRHENRRGDGRRGERVCSVVGGRGGLRDAVHVVAGCDKKKKTKLVENPKLFRRLKCYFIVAKSRLILAPRHSKERFHRILGHPSVQQPHARQFPHQFGSQDRGTRVLARGCRAGDRGQVVPHQTSWGRRVSGLNVRSNRLLAFKGASTSPTYTRRIFLWKPHAVEKTRSCWRAKPQKLPAVTSLTPSVIFICEKSSTLSSSCHPRGAAT